MYEILGSKRAGSLILFPTTTKQYSGFKKDGNHGEWLDKGATIKRFSGRDGKPIGYCIWR
jgi:hypothetical protein